MKHTLAGIVLAVAASCQSPLPAAAEEPTPELRMRAQGVCLPYLGQVQALQQARAHEMPYALGRAVFIMRPGLHPGVRTLLDAYWTALQSVPPERAADPRITQLWIDACAKAVLGVVPELDLPQPPATYTGNENPWERGT